MLVLSLCDLSGRAVQPWADAGYQCWCVDLQHVGDTRAGNIRRIRADVREFSIPALPWSMVMAWPPCTHLTRAGARWMKAKGLKALAESIAMVAACVEICEQSGAPWLLENPTGTLSTYWRQPDSRFDPCDYAGYLDDPTEDAYTKETCLWVGGGFRFPDPRPTFPTKGSMMHTMAPGPERANKRSVTPRGFARAVFLANAKKGVTP